MNKIVVLCVIMLMAASSAHALTVELDPANPEIPENCQVSVDIYANGAADLISMGVTVTFEPTALEVVDAVKGDDFVMDADGNLATTDDQYRTPDPEIDNGNGTVTLIGGRLMGENTQGLDGRVLLGTITFKGLVNSRTDLKVDLGRYHPNHDTDTFDNFVRLGGVVDEPTNLNVGAYPTSGAVLGTVCVKFPGDANGDGVVNIIDKVLVRNAFGQSGPDGWIEADVDCNGVVNILDKVKVRNAFGQSGISCTSTP
jgi:hypothetical protein